MEALLGKVLLVVFVGLAILVLGGIAVLSKYVRLMLNIIRDTPPPLLRSPSDYEPLQGREVVFRSFDGTLLRGMFLTPNHLHAETDPENDDHGNISAAARGIIIFCHEFAADMYSCSRYCQPLLEAGFDVFTFDFRGHGRSSSLPGYEARLWCTDKELADCLGALAFVRDHIETDGRPLKIGMLGVSRGAGAALLAARYADHSLCHVDAVVADGPFSTDMTLEWAMKRWVHIFARVRFVYENHKPWFWRFLRWLLLLVAGIKFHCRFLSVRKALVKLSHTPVFFIHGEKDSYIQPEHTVRLYELSSAPHYLWIVPDAKHNQSVITDAQNYQQRVVAFFEKFLTPAGKNRYNAATAAGCDAAAFFATDDAVCRPDTYSLETNNYGKNRRPMGKTCRTGSLSQRGTPVAAVSENLAPLPSDSKCPAARHHPRQYRQ